jgi:hypothetical protein
MTYIPIKSLKSSLIDILIKDYRKKISQNLPLSAYALYLLNIKNIKNEIICNFVNYNVQSRIQISKLMQIDSSIDESTIIDIIEKEKSSQVKSLLYLHFKYFKLNVQIIPKILRAYQKEKSIKVRKSILQAIRTNLKEKCSNIFISLLTTEKNKSVLITIFQTLRSIRTTEVYLSVYDWIENNARHYDFDTYHHALMIIIENNSKYLDKKNFNDLLKRSNIDIFTSWNEEVYNVCNRDFNFSYNIFEFANCFCSLSICPDSYFPQIKSVISSGILSAVLDDELQNQIDRDYFADLIKFCMDVLDTENNASTVNIVTKNPRIYTCFENKNDFNLQSELSKLLDYHKLEGICKVCKSHFIHHWPFQSFYGIDISSIISKEYCTKHRFIEFEHFAYKLINDNYLKTTFPLQKKFDILKNTDRDKNKSLYIQTVWNNEISKCKCGEDRYPLSIENNCPLCHMSNNRKTNKTFINILDSLNEINSIHYDYFEGQILDYYEILQILKNSKDTRNTEKYFLESYLFTEQQLILSWYVAQKIFEKVKYSDTIQWKSEQKAIDIIAGILKTDNVIRYKSWSWLKSPVSGYSMNVDAFFPDFNLAVEYQGLQHFEPVDYFGGEISFKEQKVRDKRKKELLLEHEIMLVEVKENELSKKCIINKINNMV